MKITCEIAITMLVLKIIEIDAACYWNFGNPGTECLMQCINENTTTVIKQIEDLYNGHSDDGKEDCRQNGIWLRLMPLTYPNNTVESNWFTAAIKVFELEFSLRDVDNVSPDAFNSNAFRTVKRLVFPNFKLELIRNGTFNGLNELEELQIQVAEGVIDIENGVLDTLKELKEFSFEQLLNRNPSISINGFTGSEPLSKLENVKIRYNLSSSINSSTFTGLTNVKYLDLSACQIESIGEHSFDPIGDSIEELNLSDNRLTTVPNELFSTILPSIRFIRIDRNNWICDCELLPFRMIIEQYPNNFTVANCISPPGCGTILESDCFDECELPSTTTTETTSTTTDISSTTTNEISSRTSTEISSTTSSITTESSSAALILPLIPLISYVFILCNYLIS